MTRVALIGAGRMGGAMAKGWLAGLRGAGISALDVVEPSPDAELLAASIEGRLRLNADPAPADVAVLAVKPQAFAGALADVKAWIGPQTLLISIMAGLTLRQLATALHSRRIIRAMPNTPGAIGLGITAFAISEGCGSADVALAQRLFAPLGETLGPLPEERMDAVTAVSGSGPAYLFLLTEALEAAARSAGLDAASASRLARFTIAGSAALLNRGEEPADLRRAVTSPGGTTAAALDVLMSPGGLPDLMRKAVEAAARRAAELSRMNDRS